MSRKSVHHQQKESCKPVTAPHRTSPQLLWDISEESRAKSEIVQHLDVLRGASTIIQPSSPAVVADSSQTTLRRMRGKVSIMKPSALVTKRWTQDKSKSHSVTTRKDQNPACFPLNSKETKSNQNKDCSENINKYLLFYVGLETVWGCSLQDMSVVLGLRYCCWHRGR